MPTPPASATTIPAAWLVIRPRQAVQRARYALVGVGVGGVLAVIAQLLDRVPSHLGLSAAFVLLYCVAVASVGGFDRLKVPALNRESEAAAALLALGDVAGAKAGLAALLPRSRRLGAFHATYVGLIGACLYLEGDTVGGLSLVDRALAAGYLDAKTAAPLRDSLRAWRVAMLLSLGDRARAEAELARGPLPPTTRVVVEACAERWPEVIELARQSLDDAATRPDHRPTLARLGAYAARALGDASATATFEAAAASAPPSPLARLMPVYQRFLGEDLGDEEGR